MTFFSIIQSSLIFSNFQNFWKFFIAIIWKLKYLLEKETVTQIYESKNTSIKGFFSVYEFMRITFNIFTRNCTLCFECKVIIGVPNVGPKFGWSQICIPKSFDFLCWHPSSKVSGAITFMFIFPPELDFLRNWMEF